MDTGMLKVRTTKLSVFKTQTKIIPFYRIAANGAGVTPGLRRRRERAERQRSFIREQELRSTPPKSFSNDDEESHRMNGGSYSHDSDGMSE